MTITSANLANAIVKLVAVDALPDLCGNLVMGNLVTRHFEPTPAQVGDTVEIATEGLDTAKVEISTHAVGTFQIPDVTKVIAVPDLLRLYMQPAIIALAEKVESDLLATYSQFTANTPLGTGGTALTEAVVDSAETALFNAKVPPSEQKFLVVDGSGYSQLRQIPRFSEYQTAGDAGLRAIVDGRIGRIKDFFVFRSQFVKKTGTGPTTVNNLAFSRSAIGLAIRRMSKPLEGTGAITEYAEYGNIGMRVTMNYRPDTLAQPFTVDILYGVGVLRNNFGVQVRG